jgi:hypothetical protein
VFLLTWASAAAGVIHVDVSGIASPTTSIQAAIDASSHGDEVVVHPGTYKESVQLKGRRIVLRSMAPGFPEVVGATIIEGANAEPTVSFSGDETTSCILSGFTITHDAATTATGSGIEANAARATIQCNVIRGNRAARGGGISRSRGLVQNNVIFGNSAEYGGGLNDCDGATIRNNTIWGNSAAVAGGGLYGCDGAAIRNCIVWNNAAPAHSQLDAPTTPSYCCIENWGGGGVGNIAANPGVADPANGDFHLTVPSPCIDAGGAGGPDLDFEGQKRPYVAVSGRGDGSGFDIGADEHRFSQIYDGDWSRLLRAFGRAAASTPENPFVVGVIGGSATKGWPFADSAPEKTYAHQVYKHWRDVLFPASQYPRATFRFVNAGLYGGTSFRGALKAERTLLEFRDGDATLAPDFVVIEFVINDTINPVYEKTTEGLLRHVLASRKQPAAIVLLTMDRKSASIEYGNTVVARHYGVPVVSVRDRLWPELASGNMAWEDAFVAGDPAHVNESGHALLAGFVNTMISRAFASWSPAAPRASLLPLPPPLHTDAYQFVETYVEQLSPAGNGGWREMRKADVLGEVRRMWRAETAGASLAFKVPGGTTLGAEIIFTIGRGDEFDGAAVEVDVNGATSTLTTESGYHSEFPEGFTPNHVWRELATGLDPGTRDKPTTHTLTFTVLPGPSTTFEIWGLMSGGRSFQEQGASGGYVRIW